MMQDAEYRIERYSNKGRIHSRRPILSFSLFACKTAADHTFRFQVLRKILGYGVPSASG
jgi:hypothetical protein